MRGCSKLKIQGEYYIFLTDTLAFTLPLASATTTRYAPDGTLL